MNDKTNMNSKIMEQKLKNILKASFSIKLTLIYDIMNTAIKNF